MKSTGYHGSQTQMAAESTAVCEILSVALRPCLEVTLLIFVTTVCTYRECVSVFRFVCYLGLSSAGALLKLTTGICSVEGRKCSEGARKGRGARRGERRGELRPLLRWSGERGARDTELCSSSPSSSSRMDGSFFTRPPLLSQSF